MRYVGIPIALRLLSPSNYKTLWPICMSSCARYGGNWMAQTLGHMLTNWPLIMHGWPRLLSQAVHRVRPICCLDTVMPNHRHEQFSVSGT